MKFGVYVHIPFCRRKCPYCAFISGDFGRTGLYLASLEREIEKRMPDEKPDTLYIGGGTPSYAGTEMICRAAAAVCRRGRPEEMTVEMNPDSISRNFMESVTASGFNRFSVGVQSSDNYTLRKLGRIYGRKKVFESLEIVSGYSSNTSVDIIWGVPGRRASFDFLDVFQPQHVSTYLLTIEQGTPFYRSGFAQKRDVYIEREYYYILEELAKRGYERYEVSNFAKKGYESRHNLIYWNRDDKYLGFGLSACSFDGRVRSCNTEVYDEYLKGGGIESVKEAVDHRTAQFEDIMLKMRTVRGMGESDAEFERIERSALERFVKSGYIKESESRIAFTDSGFLIMNTLLAELIKD